MIAFLIRELSIRGGTHKQFLKLIEYVDSQKVDFIVITRYIDYDKTYPGFYKYKDKIKTLPQINTRGCLKILKDMFHLRKMLKNIDIVNIHDCGFELLLPVFIGKKLFWQVNDLPAIFKVGVFAKRKNSVKQNVLKKYVIFFRFVITGFSVNVSKNAVHIQQIFKRKSHVFYCGIEPVGIERDITLSCERFLAKKVNLLSSGVFFPYRNYETQINIVKELLKRGIDVHLNIIGSTELDVCYTQKIRSLIKSDKLDDRINICGQVNDVLFQELHKNADFFLFINVDQSWGLAVFEAMSCGIPVVVSNSVGATEILEDSENALFVDPLDNLIITDRIIELMDDQKKYCRLSDISKQFHQYYSWNDAYCSKMIDFILCCEKSV